MKTFSSRNWTIILWHCAADAAVDTGSREFFNRFEELDHELRSSARKKRTMKKRKRRK